MKLKTVEKDRPSSAQRLVFTGVMLVLAMICAWLFNVQSKFNPAVIAFIPVEEKPDKNIINSVIHINAPLTAMSPAELFFPDTLYEKINGRADLYLTAGFKQLAAQRIAADIQKSAWMELFVYDMVQAKNAFAVYSLQKRENVKSSSITNNAYFAENAFFMTHGPYYVEIIGAEMSSTLSEAIENVAKQFIKEHPVKSNAALTEIDLFPVAGLKKESIALIPANGFGFEKLDKVFTAEFNINDTLYTGFISKRKSNETAKRLALDLKIFFSTFGGVVLENTSDIETAVIIEVMDDYEIIFFQGLYIAGVHEAKTLAGAIDLAKQIQKTITDSEKW